jgi:ornithine carbamoyltransferase
MTPAEADELVSILAPLVRQFLAEPSAASIRHYLQFSDLTADEYAWLFERAALIKKKFKAYEKYHPLADRTLAMIFEKASTRTRVSFEAGMYQMGGSVVHLTTGDSQLGRAEPIEDSARVISRMVDLVMIRTFGQDKIERFAAHSRVPVINGLTNEFHPCQILADIFTFIEHRLDAAGNRSCGARSWPGWATATTWPTPGCRPPSCWASRCM